MQTFWLDSHYILFISVLPWSLSCQRSCTPSLRTSWTGMSPRGNARRKRKRRGTVSTRRSLTKRWRPQRSLCSPLKLSYCQRRYWKNDLHQKLGHVCLLLLVSPRLNPTINPPLSFPFLSFGVFVFYLNCVSVALLECFIVLLCSSFLFSLKIFCWCFCLCLGYKEGRKLMLLNCYYWPVQQTSCWFLNHTFSE